ncbi:MAG TPA: hypothetical protein VM915_14660 [Verrucomicrobiae bacterium]|nr:hypothetical protein [Verrucomicrobiae bacterium]
MAAEASPEVKAAITKGVIAETVLLFVGGAVAFVTGQMWWIVGSAVVGSTVFVALLAQAGAFKKADER